jgi:hypothetical protein
MMMAVLFKTTTDYSDQKKKDLPMRFIEDTFLLLDAVDNFPGC